VLIFGFDLFAQEEGEGREEFIFLPVLPIFLYHSQFWYCAHSATKKPLPTWPQWDQGVEAISRQRRYASLIAIRVGGSVRQYFSQMRAKSQGPDF